MKKLCNDTPENEIVFVQDVIGTKSAILKEMFDLPINATLDDIVNAEVRLPKLEVQTITEKRLKSIKKSYEENMFPTIQRVLSIFWISQQRMPKTRSLKMKVPAITKKLVVPKLL